jgi:hypothetical protein
MPLKLNVGLSKKLGLPDYGSLGASCHVEVELDASLIQNDLDTFHRHVKNAYVACSQAVNDELARQSATSQTEAPAPPQTSSQRPSGQNGNGSSGGTNGHHASQKQVDYIKQLARQVKGLGVRRLETLAERMFGKPLAGLTSFEATVQRVIAPLLFWVVTPRVECHCDPIYLSTIGSSWPAIVVGSGQTPRHH